MNYPNLSSILAEADAERQVIVLYPGRFQPMHGGHRQMVARLQKMFGKQSVFVSTSDDTSSTKSPFSFQEKVTIMTKLCGIPRSQIHQTQSPYAYPGALIKDPAKAVVLYAVSEKDMDEDPRFAFPASGLATKKDGSPKYLQRYPGSIDACESANKHGYIISLPVNEFVVNGKPITSATEVRALLTQPSEKKAADAFTQLYSKFDDKLFSWMRATIATSMGIALESLVEASEEERMYRTHVMRQLLKRRIGLEQDASDVLGLNVVAEPYGDVMDPHKFRNKSRVQIAFYYNDPTRSRGVDPEVSFELQRALDLRFSFGVAQAVAINVDNIP